MDESNQSPPRGTGLPARAPRPISRRGAIALAGLMLAVGVGAGAAIGPAPSVSFAGASPGLIARLPELLAAIAGRDHSSTATSSQQNATAEGAEAEAQAEAAEARRRRRRRRRQAAAATTGSSATGASSEAGASGGETQTGTAGAKQKAGTGAKLPAISSVWLVELAGESFAEAERQAASAPYINATALHEGALLSKYSALDGSALASEAALLAPVPAGGSPPLVHSIVEPACPEGAAGAACSTPAGALASADAFLKEVLTSITSTAAYREHGLVVVTFASVGVAAQQGLPAAASSATLTEQPPAGVLVLSPFAKAGKRPALSFNPTSPAQSLQALLG
jgi:hypothetical protein